MELIFLKIALTFMAVGVFFIILGDTFDIGLLVQVGVISFALFALVVICALWVTLL